jgi:hypothetical protein
MFGGKFYHINVVKHDRIVLVEVIKSESAEDILKVPAVRDYLTYSFDKLRGTVCDISDAAKKFFEKNYPENSDFHREFEFIERELSEIMALVIDPEQLLYLTDNTEETNSICLKEELTKITNSLKAKIGKKIQITTMYTANLYARMNRKTFNTFISDIAYSCCHGDFLPDSLKFELIQLSGSKAKISVTADYTSQNANQALKKKAIDEMFFDYLADAFERKYKAVYDIEEDGCKVKHILEVPIINPNVGSFRSPYDFDGSVMFDAVQVRMREFME